MLNRKIKIVNEDALDLNFKEEPEEIEEENEFRDLIACLKITEDNIKILHHNLVGDNWFGDHEVLGEWYDKVGEIEDDVIEIIMSLGGKDMSISEVVEHCESIEVREYSNNEAFEIVREHFEKLIKEFQDLKDIVPGDVYSKFEEYIYYFRKEVNYKIAQRLK